MQTVTYLSFTLLSIFIQFSVIGFIQGRLKSNENPKTKEISHRRQLRDVLNEVNKPHALYYSTNKYKGIKNGSPAKFISNNSLTELLATTEITTAVFDVLYDENITSTEESFTTEYLYSTTEMENITEITFLEKINETKKVDDASKETSNEDCRCNLLMKVCDINCCCDGDCSESEIKLFPSCREYKSAKEDTVEDHICLSQLPYFDYGNGLFCLAKVNLPKDRNLVIKKTDPVSTNHYLTWNSNEKSSILYEFSNSIYKYADPVWLYKNGTIHHSDLPVSIFNSYCTGRKAMQFLRDEKIKCNVKIEDLEMFQIMKSLEEVAVISATPLSMNSSVLNCSNLHCVNWTVIVCKNLDCTNYTRNLHDPTCTESICTNLAPKIEYIFYYYDSKITNATITFHLANLTTTVPFISQEIEVKFVMGNKSIDKILKLSGNPGYLKDLPIIISYAVKNYTDAFYNTTIVTRRHLILPENKNGLCTLFNNSENYLLFGRNRRIHCRYNHEAAKFANATDECLSIQSNIKGYLELYKHILVSPLGNPRDVKDSYWISVEKSPVVKPVYGKLQDKASKLICFNLVIRFSITFGYVQVKGNNRIVSANLAETAKNATFYLDEISTIITVDISFRDVTNPGEFEYVTSNPSVNIHLPEDFLYPFRSNKSPVLINVFTMILCIISIISCK